MGTTAIPRGHISTILWSLSRGKPQNSGLSGSVPALMPSIHHWVPWYSPPPSRRQARPQSGRHMPSTSDAVWSNRTAVAPGHLTRPFSGEKNGSRGSSNVRSSSCTDARSVIFTLEKGWTPLYPRTRPVWEPMVIDYQQSGRELGVFLFQNTNRER
jgi:hypothetical protein